MRYRAEELKARKHMRESAVQRRGGVEEGKRCRKLGDEGKIKVK